MNPLIWRFDMDDLIYKLLLLKRNLLIRNVAYASQNQGRHDKLQKDLIETTARILKIENRLH